MPVLFRVLFLLFAMNHNKVKFENSNEGSPNPSPELRDKPALSRSHKKRSPSRRLPPPLPAATCRRCMETAQVVPTLRNVCVAYIIPLIQMPFIESSSEIFYSDSTACSFNFAGG
jgi:hypothetical protein